MKLSQLLKDLSVEKVIGKIGIDVENLSFKSKNCTKNSLFICIKGKDYDGHDYVLEAEKYGAKAVVCERELDTKLTQIVVKDSRSFMVDIANAFYHNPQEKLKIVGITGTNGKTTTAHVIYEILNGAGIDTALIGTLGTFYQKKFFEPTLTTPDPIELNKSLKDMVDSGVKVVVMEVSAHALYYGKIKNLDFDATVFTNFTQDHLDFFGNMENYKEAKKKLFNEFSSKCIVTNSDDDFGLELLNCNTKTISYGIENPSDVFVMKVKEKEDGTEFILNLFDCVYNVKLNLIGRYNVYNFMAGVTVATLLGLTPDEVMDSAKKISAVSGRLERVYSGKYKVYVDYAHTPDGLKKSLSALKINCKGRLISVFGCGGNRDKDKRDKMGKVSGELADFTVITSDNPRFEEPFKIIKDIESGILDVSKRYVLIQDRFEAVKYAMEMASDNDVILIAGKGCEKYQEILGVKRLYNDKDTVEEILRRERI